MEDELSLVPAENVVRLVVRDASKKEKSKCSVGLMVYDCVIMQQLKGAGRDKVNELYNGQSKLSNC